MIWLGLLIAYCVLAYVVLYFMIGSGGPGGLGWLIFPFAPVILPMMVGYGVLAIGKSVLRSPLAFGKRILNKVFGDR